MSYLIENYIDLTDPRQVKLLRSYLTERIVERDEFTDCESDENDDKNDNNNDSEMKMSNESKQDNCKNDKLKVLQEQRLRKLGKNVEKYKIEWSISMKNYGLLRKKLMKIRRRKRSEYDRQKKNNSNGKKNKKRHRSSRVSRHRRKRIRKHCQYHVYPQPPPPLADEDFLYAELHNQRRIKFQISSKLYEAVFGVQEKLSQICVNFNFGSCINHDKTKNGDGKNDNNSNSNSNNNSSSNSNGLLCCSKKHVCLNCESESHSIRFCDKFCYFGNVFSFCLNSQCKYVDNLILHTNCFLCKKIKYLNALQMTKKYQHGKTKFHRTEQCIFLPNYLKKYFNPQFVKTSYIKQFSNINLNLSLDHQRKRHNIYVNNVIDKLKQDNENTNNSNENNNNNNNGNNNSNNSNNNNIGVNRFQLNVWKPDLFVDGTNSIDYNYDYNFDGNGTNYILNEAFAIKHYKNINGGSIYPLKYIPSRREKFYQTKFFHLKNSIYNKYYNLNFNLNSNSNSSQYKLSLNREIKTDEILETICKNLSLLLVSNYELNFGKDIVYKYCQRYINEFREKMNQEYETNTNKYNKNTSFPIPFDIIESFNKDIINKKDDLYKLFCNEFDNKSDLLICENSLSKKLFHEMSLARQARYWIYFGYDCRKQFRRYNDRTPYNEYYPGMTKSLKQFDTNQNSRNYNNRRGARTKAHPQKQNTKFTKQGKQQKHQRLKHQKRHKRREKEKEKLSEK